MSHDRPVLQTLADLGFTDAGLAALRRQGFVACECCPKGRVIYKLRFRCEGRQCVGSLGSSPQTAETVRAQLQHWRRFARLLASALASRSAAALGFASAATTRLKRRASGKENKPTPANRSSASSPYLRRLPHPPGPA